jgi:hypothetical protein
VSGVLRNQRPLRVPVCPSVLSFKSFYARVRATFFAEAERVAAEREAADTPPFCPPFLEDALLSNS